MRRLLLASVPVIAVGMIHARAADLPLGAPLVPYSWTGLYLGAHVGGAVDLTKFSDPFGASIFGDTVHSPGFPWRRSDRVQLASAQNGVGAWP